MRGGNVWSLCLPGAAGATGEAWEASLVFAAGLAAAAGSDERVLGGVLRPFWAKPEAALATANTIPKSQPCTIRVFIEPRAFRS